MNTDTNVSVEAASPGELKSGGEGLTISAGFADSPFGKCLIGTTPRGICHLSFVESGDGAENLAALQENWPRSQMQRDDSAASKLAGMIFKRTPNSRPQPVLRAFVKGTEFQLKVWRALLHVQPGTLTSYGRLAAAIGNPAACRAVGTAVGKNPLAYLVPCHRVIHETGGIGNYRWGQARKRAILAWENSLR